MFDYQSIKELAKITDRSVKDLLALSQVNDPFYAGVGHRGQAAEWFAGMWQKYGGNGSHLRRLHYKIISQPTPELLPVGRPYQNTENDWTFLCSASLAARYLGLIPFDALLDRRNDEPMIFAPNLYSDPNAKRNASCMILYDSVDLEIPEMPSLPGFAINGLYQGDAIQDYIIEVWIEKSTQNDWLVPLCKRRGANLVVGIGEQSEVRSRQLAFRSDEYGAPVRIIYLSDFDPGGRSMPKAVARKVEFTIAKFGLDADVQLIPLVLTPDQCRQYDLPRTPIKETERRKNKFELMFGVGATELDALEATNPGEMARLLEAELDNFLDTDLGNRVARLWSENHLAVRKIEQPITDQYSDEFEDLSNRFEVITQQLRDWEEEAAELWSTVTDDLEENMPDLSDVEVPRSTAPGDSDRFILFDSTRDYLTQMDYYNAWKDGDE